MNMRLYQNSFCIKPSGIGRYATNMIVQFMDSPFGVYRGDPINFNKRKSDWNIFKVFLLNISKELGATQHLYLNDGYLERIGELASTGKTIKEMVDKAKSIIEPCLNVEQFINHHTWIRPDGIRNLKDNIWFVNNINNYKEPGYNKRS